MLRHLKPIRAPSAPIVNYRAFSSTGAMSDKLLIYLMRRDLRVADNPVLHRLTKDSQHGFTHLLPLYVFPAQQVEVGGFIQGEEKSPYPEARSPIAAVWRCGPHRAKFLAESVWNLKEGLEKVGSGLTIRVGMVSEVVKQLLEETKASAVWMTGEEGVEEEREEKDVKNACNAVGADFSLFTDEKYLIDDRDLHRIQNPQDLPDVFTTYRKMMEPLRDAPRSVLPTVSKDSLPPLPSEIPPQHKPFTIPTTFNELLKSVMKPLEASPLIKAPSPHPTNAESAHPFHGGEDLGHKRLESLLSSGSMSAYKDTRNGLIGTEFSSKLSAYLSIGCITARQIHASMLAFEDGTNPAWKGATGYGKGENSGTQAMRFELLWRDYMRLCTRKFGPKLFRLSGFIADPEAASKWSRPDRPKNISRERIQDTIERFFNGTTGMGLIDASQRELYHTGYTSNRARQNVASFLAKHLYIDWRIGAEWYESMLVDYDLSSNWGNWQYVAGVGNDPRGPARVFNPVKQSFDYDPKGDYVKMWVPETRSLEDVGEIFQVWTVPRERRGAAGLVGKMAEEPLKRIEFTVGRAQGGRGRGRGRGGGGGGGGGSSSRGGGGGPSRGGGGGRYGGRGYGSSKPHSQGGRNPHGAGGGGREARSGVMDQAREAGLA